ncbi:MAG: ATP-binding cassette domain-containing protein [Planctomycetota bacterium]
MISVHDISKRFTSGERAVTAVDHLSFAVSPGEVYGLMGPNGAGKTTTLGIILGLLKPDTGYAQVGNLRTDAQSDAVKALIGCVTANDGLYPWLSVRETLLFFADLYGVPPEKAAEHVRSLVERFGMQDYIDRRAVSLSTGQKQRAILSRGLVHDPPVMLLDEPTRGLDVVGSQIVFDYIHDLRQQGKAVILSTHRLDEAQRLCDRFGLLHRGKLWNEGTLEQLREKTGSESLVDMFQELVAIESQRQERGATA